MRTNAIIILISLLIFSCSKDRLTKKIFYPSGKLEEKRIYKSMQDIQEEKSYKSFSYYETGEIMIQTEYELGMINGSYLEFYPSGKLRRSIIYNNGKKEGVEKHYSENGELVEELFFINDVPLIKMKSYNSNYENLDFFYYIEEDTMIENGLLVKDNQGKIVERKSFYYNIISNDTIVVNKPHSLKIETYTMGQKNTIKKAIFGVFDEFYNFKNDDLVELKSNNNQVLYEFTPKEQGDLLIMGKIYIQGDPYKDGTLEREFIVYKQLFVR